jgi:AbiJ N-terminal domain 4
MDYELYSLREKRLSNSETKEVYRYKNFPDAFFEQVIHIWHDTLGCEPYGINLLVDENWFHLYTELENYICREKGFRSLGKGDNSYHRCVNYLRSMISLNEQLDLIEYSFRLVQKYSYRVRDVNNHPAIKELNKRLQQHSLGYAFVSGQIIRMDTEYAHKEIVLPAINFISHKKFTGAEEEFLKAHEHYRHGKFKEAINEALKALESTLKTICKANRIEFPPNCTSNGLLNKVFESGLVAPELKSHFTSIRSCLESGVPTIRNKKAGHGQGVQVETVPEHFVQFALHSTAVAISFLIAEFHSNGCD